MSRCTKDKVSKTLVRNVVEKLPDTSALSSGQIQQKGPLEPRQSESKFKKIVVGSVPSTNSTNLIVQNIRNLKNTKNVNFKTITELEENKQLATQEKLTRQMNFPHEQAIYKNLIPLCVKPSSTSTISSRDPLPQKDREPKLSDFYQTTPLPELKYILPTQPTSSASSLLYDGFQIHRIMGNWK